MTVYLAALAGTILLLAMVCSGYLAAHAPRDLVRVRVRADAPRPRPRGRF
ncbi:hypothetical protein ACWEVD_17935 [Nocardia thailandica]|uniref:Uncharacterized protein n=1 Tax=Nocardia thailandica TaxID=257275 RepID=A0ABW6PGU8_9NOCA|nr:hypothetical protein [Nocardia thailandica]